MLLPEAKGFQNLEIRFVVSSWQVNLVFVTTCVMTKGRRVKPREILGAHVGPKGKTGGSFLETLYSRFFGENIPCILLGKEITHRKLIAPS